MAVRAATQLARAAPNRETTIAHGLVKSLYDDGRLDEHQVEAFAAAGKFDETNAAIAALANVSVSIAENMMVETRAEGVMILAKVAGLSWSTVKAIIDMRDDLSGLDRSISRPARRPTNGCGPRPPSRCCASTRCSRRRRRPEAQCRGFILRDASLSRCSSG